MKRFTLSIATSAACLMMSGCITMPGSQNPAHESNSADIRECAKNYVIDGSALSLGGTKFITTAFVAGVSKNEAMSRASKKLAQDGLSIATMDREAGLLTATNKVIFGTGNRDTAPFSMTFEGSKGGVQMQLKYAISFGQMAGEDDMKSNLCSVVEAVSGKR